MVDQYENKIQQALKNVETQEETISSPFITLSSGVVLRLKKINVLRINAVVDQFKYPDIPETWDSNKERPIKNPDSPEYKQMCAEIDAQRIWALLDAIAVLGTEIESVPKEVPLLESDEWIDELKVLKIGVDAESKLARYMAWIKFVAILDRTDLNRIAEQFGVQMGISEAGVSEEIRKNFPNQT